ncbi:MAG TPA: hypothetical protein VJ927_07205 [Actinomycetota bacterium]|nr:hypothetical protein [Actinomycetota bacterium]
MVDTIGPMVRGAESRGTRVELAHVGGGLLGGAVTGFLAGALGALFRLGGALDPWATWTMVGAVVVAFAYDSLHEGRKLGLARQTPRAWRHVLPAGAAAFFNGFDLGLGWSTRIYFTSYVVAVAAAVLSGHALAGAAIGASFGAARAGFVVLAQRRSTGALSIDTIAARRGLVSGLNAVALVQFAVVTTLVG